MELFLEGARSIRTIDRSDQFEILLFKYADRESTGSAKHLAETLKERFSFCDCDIKEPAEYGFAFAEFYRAMNALQLELPSTRTIRRALSGRLAL